MLVSGGRTVVTARHWIDKDGDLQAGHAHAIDTIDGTSLVTHDGCWIGAVHGDSVYQVCRLPAEDGQSRDQVFVTTADGPAELVTFGPDVEYPLPIGHWRSILASADGTELLGQWSGECEIPTAFRINVDEGSREMFAGDLYESAPASYALGWAPSGEAVVLLEGGELCAEAAEEPGVHLFSASGASTRIYDTGPHFLFAQMWQPLD